MVGIPGKSAIALFVPCIAITVVVQKVIESQAGLVNYC